MNIFEDIETRINKLKIDADENLMDCLNQLHDQLHRAANAQYSIDDLIDMMFSHDVLEQNFIEQDTALWQEIRDIQQDIVNNFSVKQLIKKSFKMECECCDEELFVGEKLKTRSGHFFCSYACFENCIPAYMEGDDELDQRITAADIEAARKSAY